MKNINWKLRFMNKTTLVSLASAVVVFVFAVTTALGIELPVSQESVMGTIVSVLTVLCALGIIVDPTTAGITDSERAMSYETPKEN